MFYLDRRIITKIPRDETIMVMRELTEYRDRILCIL